VHFNFFVFLFRGSINWVRNANLLIAELKITLDSFTAVKRGASDQELAKKD